MGKLAKILFILILLASSVSGTGISPEKNPYLNSAEKNDTENGVSSRQTDKDRERQINNSYIIELEEDSSANRQIGELDTMSQDRTISQKEMVISSMEEKAEKEFEVEQSYESSFNGLTVANISNSTAEDIREMDGVEEVYRDRVVNLHLSDSVPNIGAAEAHLNQVNGTNLTGKGVEVAVIDSGTNYTRPSLGGCSFEEMNNSDPGDCRFLPGYDFVDDDYDPMDDGHGTHVTGIVGSNGSSMTGVAPGAKIRAYRVCESGCMISDVVAAVERAMDPDGDGDTDDHVDVIQMSLGGPGYPSGPMAQAVNEAEEAGIIPVVSAGNSGSLSETVSTPAAARNALAVGSVNDQNELNQFSSRGPQKVKGSTELLLKPEISAPGNEINSTYQGGFEEKSGTSMAAPHVSGAAALVLQKYPSLTPKELTGLLAETSTKIDQENNGENADISEAGTGRVNVTSALETSSVAVPEAISFGLSNSTGKWWNTSENISVRNFGDSAKYYTLSVDQTPEGVQIDFNSSGFEIGPDGAREVEINLSMNKDQVSESTYTGLIQVESNTSEDLSIPYLFEHEDFSLSINPDSSSTGKFRLHFESPMEFKGGSKELYLKGPDGNWSNLSMEKKNYFREKKPENQDWYKKLDLEEEGEYTAVINSSMLPGKEDSVSFEVNRTAPELDVETAFHDSENRISLELDSNSSLEVTTGKITSLPPTTNLFTSEGLSHENRLHLFWGEIPSWDAMFPDTELKYGIFENGEVQTVKQLSSPEAAQAQGLEVQKLDNGKALVSWRSVFNFGVDKCDPYCNKVTAAVVDLEEQRVEREMNLTNLTSESDVESIAATTRDDVIGITWMEDSANRSSGNPDSIMFRTYNRTSGKLSDTRRILYNSSGTPFGYLDVLPHKNGFELYWQIFHDDTQQEERLALYSRRYRSNDTKTEIMNATKNQTVLGAKCSRTRGENLCMLNIPDGEDNYDIYSSKSSDDWSERTWIGKGVLTKIESSEERLAITYNNGTGSVYAKTLQYRDYNGSWNEPREIDSSIVPHDISSIGIEKTGVTLGIVERTSFIPTTLGSGQATNGPAILKESDIGDPIDPLIDYEAPVKNMDAVNSENFHNMITESSRNRGYYAWGTFSFSGPRDKKSVLRSSKPPQVEVILPGGEKKTSHMEKNGGKWELNISSDQGGMHLYSISAVDQSFNVAEEQGNVSRNISSGSNLPPSRPEWNGPDGTVDELTPELNWTESSDSEGDELRYILVVDDNDSFGSPEVFRNLNRTSYTMDLPPGNYSNRTFNYRLLSTDTLQNSEVTRGSFRVNISVDFSVKNETEIHENITINSSNYGEVTVSKTDSDWSYTTPLENRNSNYSATLPLHRHGYYSVKYERIQDGETVNSATRTIFVNSSKPELGSIDKIGIPADNQDFALVTPIETETEPKDATMRIWNSTDSEEVDADFEVDSTTSETDPATGQGYKEYTGVRAGAEISLPEGSYNASFTVENTRGESTANSTFRVVGEKNLTVSIDQDGDTERGVTLLTGDGSNQQTYDTDIADSRNITAPNLSAIDRKYSIAVLEDKISEIKSNAYILDRKTNITDSVTVKVSENTETKSVGGKIIYSSFAMNHPEKDSANESKVLIERPIDEIKSESNDYEDLTVYSCPEYDFGNGECSESWIEPDDSDREESDSSLSITGTVSRSEAVAIGEPDDCPEGCEEESDGSGGSGSSGGGSVGGGFSGTTGSSEEPEVESTADGVVVSNLENGAAEPEELENIRTVGLGSETDNDYTVEISSSEPEEQDVSESLTEISTYSISVEVNDEENSNPENAVAVNFTVSDSRLEALEVEPEDVSLYHHDEDDEWEEVETEYIEEQDIYSAELREFSQYMIAAEKRLCPQVITPARNPEDGSCRQFSTPCKVPEGWNKVDSCSTGTPPQNTDETTPDGENSPGIIKLAGGAILLTLAIAAAGLIGFRRHRRNERVEELVAISEEIRESMANGEIDQDRRVLQLLEEAKQHLDDGEIDQAAEKIIKLKKSLRTDI